MHRYASSSLKANVLVPISDVLMLVLVADPNVCTRISGSPLAIKLRYRKKFEEFEVKREFEKRKGM